MKFNKRMKLSKGVIAILTALLMILSMFGCSMSEIGENAELAGDILEIVGELLEETAEHSTTLCTDSVTECYQYDNEPGSEPETFAETELQKEAETEPETEYVIEKDGYYYSKEDVSLYIYTYGELPDNFITKAEAEDLGWQGGSVERFLDGAAIGGDVFKNREGILPKSSGRIYYECDIDTDGENSRGAKRIVFSNDGLIYYTGDHYESFTLLYGKE